MTVYLFCFAIAAPVPPMRYTDSKYEDEFGLEDSANILSVGIVSSDVGFPLNIYGTVIARDSIDYKCIYLFQHGRDDCQPIKLKVPSYSKSSIQLVFILFRNAFDINCYETSEWSHHKTGRCSST
jgi:hypothetical protein